MYDLHTHSTASDGQYAPSQLLQLALENGVGVFAITDHDSIGGILEGMTAAERLGIHFVPGIEISVKGAREMHILGYGIDITSDRILEMCKQFQQFREARKYRIIDFLKKRGISLSLEDVARQAGSQLIARPHFARAMVEAGYVSTVREAFDLHLGTPDFDQIERPKPSPKEGISIIHSAGGVAVLAHPCTLKLDPPDLKAQVEALACMGLDGLECHYHSFSAEQSAEYCALAHQYGLLITGGSDFHGELVKPDIVLGGFSGNNMYDGGEKIYQEILQRCLA